MHHLRGPAAVLAASSVLLALATGVAGATTTSPAPTGPTPVAASSTASPSAGPESPAPAGSPPAAPESRSPAPTSRPVPTSAPSGAPGGATGTIGDPLPTAPNDGVDLGTGQTDEYLALAATRDQAAALVTARRTALASAHATVVWYQQQAPALRLATAVARVRAESAQSSTDDVVRALYQRGDAGLGPIAAAIAAGPQAFLDGVDSQQMATSTASGVVNDSITARNELALAEATEQAFDLTLVRARETEAQESALLATAVASLASIDAKLALLGATAPQVAIGVDGCPLADVPGTLRDGSDLIGAAVLCRSAVRQAATPQAALAITWAFQHLGSAYACKGVGRMQPYRADCSSLVSRAYHEGAGLGTAGDAWAPSTRDMVPWDGVRLDPHYAYVAPQALRPGDLVLYDTCPQGGCPYKHVAMYLGTPDGGRTRWMLHTNACGDVAKVAAFWGFPTTGHPFLVARRVVALPGEALRTIDPAAERRNAALGPMQVAGLSS